MIHYSRSKQTKSNGMNIIIVNMILLWDFKQGIRFKVLYMLIWNRVALLKYSCLYIIDTSNGVYCVYELLSGVIQTNPTLERLANDSNAMTV